jgi:opacity protein-like surface antigen
MPLLFRVGLSMDVLKGVRNNRLIVSLDALHPNNDTEYLNVGCEYGFANSVFLRAGYKTLWAAESQEGLSLGAGLQYRPASRVGLKLDYGYQNFGYLKDIQMFSILLSF